MTHHAPPQPNDRTKSLEWSGEDVNLGEVMHQLGRIDAELRRHDATGEEHSHPRNCVMNLVAVMVERRSLDRAAAGAAELAAHHPLRLLTVRIKPEGGSSRLDARVASHAHQAPGSHPVQYEQVGLELSGPICGHLRGLLEPLLVADVRTFVWWERASFGEPGFDDLLGLADAVVVDSADRSLVDLAAMADRLPPRTGLIDLHWGRQRRWRERLLELFTPPERRAFLEGIERCEIGCSSAPAAATAGLLVAGWLATSLGWGLKEVEPGLAVLAGPKGERVECRVRRTRSKQAPPDQLAAVRLEASAGKARLRVGLERHPTHPGVATAEVEISGSEPVRQLVALPDEGDADLFIWQAARSSRDQVYLGALAAAAGLVGAMA